MTTPTEITDAALETDEGQEALFAQLSKQREAASNEPVADTPLGNVDEPAPEPTPEPVAAVVPATSATEAVAPTTPDPLAAPPTPPAPAAEPAIDLSKLDEATRKYVERMENERRAAVGRAAAIQRQADAEKRRAVVVPPTPAPAAESENLKKEFPQLSAAVDQRLAESDAKFTHRLETATSQVKAEALETLYPGWLTTMQSPEFSYWLEQQDEVTRKKFDGDSLGDYASLLKSYTTATDPAPAPPPPALTDVERIQQERNARLTRSAHVPSKSGAPNPTGEPDAESDPEGYFNWLARKRDKDRERAAAR